MNWTQPVDTETRIEWERADGYAHITARRTATGSWAVTLDRLEQAPEGPTYVHETAGSREQALEIVTPWLDDYEIA